MEGSDLSLSHLYAVLLQQPCQVVYAVVQRRHLPGVLLPLLAAQLHSVVFSLIEILIGLD